MENLVNIVNSISNELWSKWVLIALLGTGVLVIFATGGIQKKLGLALKRTANAYKKSSKSDDDGENSKGNISSIQALSTALASTIGVGNIVGVGTAIAMGGPGAIFWMWISALLGMGTKYAEIVLALTYREEDEDGIWRGGPMYVFKNGLKAPWAGTIFAICMTLVALISLVMNQVSAAANSLQSTFSIPPIVTGIIVTLLTALVIFGGLKRIGRVAEVLVPFMAILYCFGGAIIIILNITHIPAAFAIIFKSAFSGHAAIGGFTGATIAASARFGVARGLLSNEAGCGTAPMAHASAKVKHPVEQGLFGISEVFIDTFVVCTFTALVILVTGVWKTGESGVTLSASAFSANLGIIGEAIVAIGIALFAFSTVLGGSWYGETSITYVFGSKSILSYKVLTLIVCFIGSILGSDFLFSLTDVANGLAVLVNVVSVLLLLKVVSSKTKEYFSDEDIKATNN